MKELLNRLLFVLISLIIFRIGSHIPVPGISPDQLQAIFSGGDTTFIGLFNLFSGGALANMSIFALGIVPYITASIIMQLLQVFLPSLEQMRKEGEAGRAKITGYTRIFTVFLALIQSFALCTALRLNNIFVSDDLLIFINAILTITTGCAFLMWLGEQINERGIGNGISMLIFFGIISSLPVSVFQTFEQTREGTLSILGLLSIGFILLLVALAVIFFERGQRKIALQYSNKQAMMQRGMGNNMFSYFPLKINMAGVVPVIFASSILLVPFSLTQWFQPTGTDTGIVTDVIQNLSLALQPNQPLYLILFVSAVVFFCFFYTAIVFHPNDIAKNLKRSNAFIPGIRPGSFTAQFFDQVMTRLTFVGAIYISVVSLLPQLIALIIDIPFLFAGTSILIVIVVVMDFMSQIQSHLFSAHYSGLLNKTNLRNYNR